MDQTLIDLLNEKNADGSISKNITILNGQAGEIEFDTKDGVRKYTLKPLAEMYGEGRGFSSVDPLNSEYQDLVNCIEQSILTYYEGDEDLTDGLVMLVLDRMGVNPACDPHGIELCRCIQFDLRLLLSMNNYSKQETRQACRVISKSVQRHTKVAGITGYLEFIVRQFRG